MIGLKELYDIADSLPDEAAVWAVRSACKTIETLRDELARLQATVSGDEDYVLISRLLDESR